MDIKPQNIGYFWCGKGHIEAFGDEQWHYESHAHQTYIKGVPVPRMCWHIEGEETCTDSTHIVGPFESREAAQEDLDAHKARLAERDPLKADYEVWYFGPVEQYRILDRLTKEEALQRASSQEYYKAVKVSREEVTA